MTTFNDPMMPALAYSKKRNIRISKCSVCVIYIRHTQEHKSGVNLELTMPALAIFYRFFIVNLSFFL